MVAGYVAGRRRLPRRGNGNRLTNLLATWGVVIAARAAMEAAVVSGTTDFMLRRQRMLELDAAVTIASLRAS